MKKSEWTYLANAMWSYSEKNEGKISNLLKELIIKINKGEVIIDDNEKIYEIIRSDGVIDSNTTSNTNFEGTGEF
jgi:hypothetical protein